MSVISSFCPGCQRTVYVSASDSPSCPVCASPLVAAQPEETARVVRIANNESLFREVNERIDHALNETNASNQEATGFVCECGAADCTETITIAPSQYEAVRANPARFILLPDHIAPEAERMVEDHDDYLVVEKIGPGRVVAEERDTR